MKKTLIMTVGGSHQPILTSISQQHADKVYFLCSEDSDKLKGSHHQVTGEGKVLKSRPDLDKPDQPSIVTLAGLPTDQFHVQRIPQYDDLNSCYLEAVRMIERARQEFPDTEVVVDYTGGTKSMTAGLAAAALDDGRCGIVLVVGRRADLVKVQDQTEFVRPVPVWDAQMLRRVRLAHDLIQRFDYAGAESLLRDAAARFAGDHMLGLVRRGLNLCRGFDGWDRFDHAMARSCLGPDRGSFVPHWRFLEFLTEKEGHGFEWVEDLLRNAERRQVQGRFDDAVGRIYRAIEMTAQAWLDKRHGLDTSAIDLARVPEVLRDRLAQEGSEEEEGKPAKIKIGLFQAWDLLRAFPDDPLGTIYAPRRGKLQHFLTVRNQSLFAHGIRPVSRTDYENHFPWLKEFLTACMDAAIQALGRKRPVILPQLPTAFLEKSL